MSAEGFAFVLQAVGRLGLYVCVFVLVGLGAFRLIVLPHVAKQFKTSIDDNVDGRLARVALVASGVLVGVCAVRLFAQTYSIFGVDEGVSLEFLQIVAMDTPWGTGWRYQSLASLGVLVGAILCVKRLRHSWFVVMAMSVAVVVALPLTGHAMSQPVGKLVGGALQTVHILGASVWIGLLFVVLAFGLRGPDSVPNHIWEAGVVQRFSPIALAAVGALLMGGVMSAFVFLDSWSQLTNTGYGRTLLGKIGFFAATGLVGAYNWRVLRPNLGSAGSGRALRRSIGAELAVALIVLGVTAVMVALPLEH